jgi:MFS family permease
MRRDELFRARAVGRHGAGIRGALAYIGRKPTIIWCLLLLGVVSVFSMNQGVLLSAMAAGTFHSGAAGYGLYSAMSAVGALVGAALAARYPRYQLRVIVLWTMLLGAVTMAGAVPVLGVFLPAIVAGGALQLLFTTSDETLTQLSARAAIRGRIMAFFLIVTFGGRALGGLLIGQVAQQGGPQLGFLVSGAVPLLAGAVAALVLFRLRPEIDHPLGKGDAS